MVKQNVKNTRFQITNSRVEGFKEVQVTFEYKGEEYKYYVFVEEGQNVDYIKEAKKRFESELRSGKVGRALKLTFPTQHVAVTATIGVLSAAAIACGGLFIYRSLNPVGVADSSHTVTFESNGGSHVETVKVKDGEMVAEPDDPTKDNYNFDSWCTDEALTNEYDFESTAVTDDLNLFAKWTPDEYTITFDTDGGSAKPAD